MEEAIDPRDVIGSFSSSLVYFYVTQGRSEREKKSFFRLNYPNTSHAKTGRRSATTADAVNSF